MSETKIPAQHFPSRAWYSSTIGEFLGADPSAVLGQLTAASGFTLLSSQIEAWKMQIEYLREELNGVCGSIFMEFSIPRMGRRIDVVLLIGPVVFAVEFKVGETTLESTALNQVWDYALDLKNFHSASHSASIVPILIATESKVALANQFPIDPDGVFRPVAASREHLRDLITNISASLHGDRIDSTHWAIAPYHPSPTIIEAARALYAQHSVDALARYDAGARNLKVTSARIEELVGDANRRRRKVICFVTGVPGAGKTLVGLNVATRKRDIQEPTHAVFLSGNGPLVAVLREALTRDELMRQKAAGNKPRKGKIAESVKAFIQNVHHFRDDLLVDKKAPIEHVAIFDEAQRAWDLQMTADFMKRKKNHVGFAQSEPEFLISCMDRHPAWAVIVSSVGGDQSGRAG
jgi:hypothetical protein